MLVKPPYILRALYSKAIWRVNTQDKKIYLTFDDGPIPKVTPWVLETLERYKAKATFFCVGENMVRNRSIFDELLTAGHALGNHSYNHINGWKVDTASYLNNIEKCQQLHPFTLFRPPYGRMRYSAYLALQKKYKIIMWDTLTMDYSASISDEKCFLNATTSAKSGSIIVFHDNIKSEQKIKNVLPRVLDYYSNKGFLFESIT